MASDEQGKREKDRQFREEALRWLPDVTRYALSLTRNEADADDLVQETFLRAYRSWDSYTSGTESRGWLFTICRNLFLRTRQREGRQVQCDDPELEALAAAAVHASAQQSGYGDLFARIDLSEAVERALAGLPEAFREAVILVDLQDQSYETAADVLNVPVGTVRSRLFRGRRLLQEALLTYARDAGLAPAGGEPSESEFRS
jgi:RNA polymerase sigma-70 factor (ECF subfamily)